MKFKLHIHKDAQKAFAKAPYRIRMKSFRFLEYLMDNGLNKSTYKIKALQGDFKKFKYLEVKIDKDYRIIFRLEGQSFFIRDAGTHNHLGTG